MLSPKPKDDCEKLMCEMLPFAKRMLSEHGEFFPFGGALNTDGSITHVGASEEGTDTPQSQTLISILKRHFQESATRGEIIASAIVFDVLIEPPGSAEKCDAVQINLDHRDGYTVEVLFPYQIIEGAPVYAASFAQEGEGGIFPQV